MNLFRVPAGIALLLGGAIFAVAGQKAGVGYLLGLSASIFNLVGLWLGIRTFANVRTLSSLGGRQTFLIGLMCFVKMPVFIGAGFFAWKVGSPAPTYYLEGVGLVYSVMIWWAFKTR